MPNYPDFMAPSCPCLNCEQFEEVDHGIQLQPGFVCMDCGREYASLADRNAKVRNRMRSISRSASEVPGDSPTGAVIVNPAHRNAVGPGGNRLYMVVDEKKGGECILILAKSTVEALGVVNNKPIFQEIENLPISCVLARLPFGPRLLKAEITEGEGEHDSQG
jgi:hypothetical protein